MRGGEFRNVVIAGAGHAGTELAAALVRKGYQGSVALFSDEDTMPYQRPPLSKEYLLGNLTREQLLLRPERFWQDSGIELELGQAVVMVDGANQTARVGETRQIGFDWFVFATGGRVKRLDCAGCNLAGIHTLRGLKDIEAIRIGLEDAQEVAIIGAGYIGLEFAAVARMLGKRVNVIEIERRVLSRVTSPEISAFYGRVHREKGVRFHFNQTVAAFFGDRHVERMELTNGKMLPVDMVIVGIGIEAECSLAERSGIDCEEGIVVDEAFATSVPGVLAIGDCARHPNRFAGGLWRLESVQHAQDSADIAANVIMGEHASYDAVPTFWSEQYDLRMQSAGIAIDADQIITRGDIEMGPFSAIYLRGGKIIAIDAINSSRDFLATRKMIRDGAKPDPVSLADGKIPLKSLS